MEKTNISSRREWLGNLLMGWGLALSYGLFGLIGLLFLLPRRLKTPTRFLYAGSADRYQEGTVQIFYDLQGTPILVRRDAAGFQAFSSVCPHLGCRVRWEKEKNRFFCPCHGGAFDQNGTAISGPPAEGKQNLTRVPLKVDAASGVVYIEVKDLK